MVRLSRTATEGLPSSPPLTRPSVALAVQPLVFDVIIIGAAPPDSSAALVLARCRRRLLLCDAGLRRVTRARPRCTVFSRATAYRRSTSFALDVNSCCRYGVEPRETTVTELVHLGDAFEATLDAGEKVQARMALIASGVRDHLPDIPGLDDCYGVTVHHCPYCDGWEHRDRAIARDRTRDVRRRPRTVAEELDLACRAVHAWGIEHPPRGSHEARERTDCGAVGRALPASSTRGRWVRSIAFADGTSVACDAIFFPAAKTSNVTLPRASDAR